MIFEYARISTKTQVTDINRFEAQEEALRAAESIEIYGDAFINIPTECPKFDKFMADIKSG